ncbi:MAG: hypothetical protein ACREDR_39455, partial [Blastocatellia bacterium]
ENSGAFNIARQGFATIVSQENNNADPSRQSPNRRGDISGAPSGKRHTPVYCAALEDFIWRRG